MDYSLVEQDLEGTPEGEVYFIFMEGDDQKCKIGKSDNPTKRTSQLQTGNPYELYVYKTLPGYARLEKMLHNYFKEKNIKREWFNITFEDVDGIVEQYYEAKEENELFSELEENNKESEEKDNILDNGTIELIEETETTVIKKKVYRMKKELRPFICEKCGRGFTQDRYLQNHLNKKVSCDKKHVCIKCHKEFTSNSALVAHLNRVTSCVPEEIPVIDIKKDEHRCQYCNKTYSNKQNLKRHQQTCDKEINMRHIMELMADKDKIMAEKDKVIQLQQQLQLLINNDITSVTNNITKK